MTTASPARPFRRPRPAAILFAAIGSSLVFLNVSAYWLRAVQGLMILATVLADMARRRRI